MIDLNKEWERLPDRVDPMSGLRIREVKCRKCGNHETYPMYVHAPTHCYVCGEERFEDD